MALILSDDPKDRRAGTLIVAPTSLVGQWETEFETKVDPHRDLNIVMYHGSNRGNETFSSADVVLTTYGILASEYANKSSKLYTTHWRRVVLDEAHVIRNGGTSQSSAALALKADGRWCLTGTALAFRYPRKVDALMYKSLLPNCRHPGSQFNSGLVSTFSIYQVATMGSSLLLETRD